MRSAEGGRAFRRSRWDLAERSSSARVLLMLNESVCDTDGGDWSVAEEHVVEENKKWRCDCGGVKTKF